MSQGAPAACQGSRRWTGKEIINKDKELKSLDKNKNIKDDEEDKKEDVSEANHKRFIKKINKYYTIQIGFIDTNVSENNN